MIVTKQDNSDMHIRTHSLPASRYTLILGRILGSSAFLFAISIAVIFFTKYAYGVNWNGNIFVILGTLFAFSIISVGLGVLIGLIIPGFATSLMVILMLVMFFGIVSGAISPTVADGVIAMLSPNYHAKIIIFGSIYKYPTSVIMESVIWLAGFITVIYGTSAALIGRRKYDNI
jgi:ABC-type multidrug transport system permease subunit